MANYTPNYNLGKPDATDQYGLFRQLFNDNMDIIDENLGGGGGSGNVDDVEVNGVSVLDPVTKIAEITSYEEVTQAEYNALPDDKLSNGIAYFIKDSVNGADGFPPLIYSLEERQVGVWTDGKPLYQKTCIFDPPFSSGNNTFNLNLSSDCVIKNYVFFVHDNVSSPITIGQGDELKMINVGYASGINRAVVWIANGTLPYLSNGQLWITVQYTKTTDVAGSGDWTPSGALAVHYSTNEQVIGTWIDGKTLYGRIITGNLNGASSGTFYINYADISADVEEVIFYDGNIRYNYNLAGTDLVWFNINTSTADNNFKMTIQNQLMASGAPTNRLAIFLSNQSFAKMDLYRIKVQYTKTTD